MKNTKGHELARKGRNGDTHVAHLADGEMIVPPVISDEMREALYQELLANGIDPEEYLVGSDRMSINPETGMPEFGFFKKVLKGVKKIAGFAAPFAAPFILGPAGLGLTGGALTAGSAALGAAGGALSGGGLKGALLGGVTGGLSGGLGDKLVGSLSSNLSQAATKGLSSALTGAVAGLGSGNGLKGALLGGTLGGLGSYAMAGGNIPGLGNMGDVIKWDDGGTSLARGTGTGVLGKVADAGHTLGGLTKGGTNVTAGGGNSSYSAVSPVVSGAMDYMAQDKAADALEKQQRRALGYITPIMNETFDPGDLEQTPGYQFNLGQGQKALDRAASARGGYFSGQALTDASQYAQGLAQNTYQDAYNNWLSDRNQRLAAAGGAADITQGIGSTRANSILNQGQTLAQSASALLGALGGGNVYNPKTGTYYDPMTKENGLTESVIADLLRRYPQLAAGAA